VSIPGGDAMSVRFRRDEEAVDLKREKIRRPVAWRIHPDDAAEFAAGAKHCEARRGNRRCRDPIAVVTWRWFRSSAAGRVLVVERFVCDEHGAGFAARHRIEIDPAPDAPSTSRRRSPR